ncbi:MAG: CheY-like chemotaxis protein [Patiriisocius sp.]|jgi:CheY-like chemotaxis protein
MRVLVVEDDLALEKAIVDTLTQMGHVVTSAQCLRDGALAVENDLEEFDVIVTDVQLPTFRDSPRPDGSGLDIVRRLVRHEGNVADPIPVYVHSSDTTDRGTDIAQWLKEKYPSAVFRKKHYDVRTTTQAVVEYINSIDSK